MLIESIPKLQIDLSRLATSNNRFQVSRHENTAASNIKKKTMTHEDIQPLETLYISDIHLLLI